MLVILCGLIFSTGCISIAHTTNIKAPPDKATLSLRHKFRIENVHYAMDSHGQAVGSAPLLSPNDPTNTVAISPQQSLMYWDNDRWLNEVRKTALSRYPSIFAATPSACPLAVTINVDGHVPNPALIVTPMLLTALILGGVLPLYNSETMDFNVSPALLLDQGTLQAPLASVQFHRKSRGWITVFTPLGLIPLPGHADKRDTMNLFPIVFNDKAPLPVPEKAFNLNVESCVDAIVLSLQSSAEEIRKALAAHGVGEGITSP